MKRVLAVVVGCTCTVLALTGCNVSNQANKSSSNNSTEVSSVQVNEKISESEVTESEAVKSEAKELENFDQLVSFFESDPGYDPERMVYNIYIQRVEVYGAENGETQLMVGSQVRNIENGKTADVTIAAKEDFKDPFKSGGSFESAKETWYKEGTPYTAASIIEAAQKEANVDEYKLYERHVLVSTF